MANKSAPSSRDILAQQIADSRPKIVEHLAEMLMRDGIATVPSGEQRSLFWQRNPDVDEATAWAEEMARAGVTAETMTPEQGVAIGLEVSKRVYPWRWDMLTGSGRDDQSDQARWAWKYAQTGPPRSDVESEDEDEDETPAEEQAESEDE